MKETSACITVKDHKEGFLNKLSLHLNNSSKYDIGKISKKYSRQNQPNFDTQYQITMLQIGLKMYLIKGSSAYGCC